MDCVFGRFGVRRVSGWAMKKIEAIRGEKPTPRLALRAGSRKERDGGASVLQKLLGERVGQLPPAFGRNNLQRLFE